MSGFCVLDASEAEARARWLRLWAAWPAREVPAHPAYVRLLARPEDRVLCAAMTTEGGGILYPFLLRPLSAEPWTGAGERSWDLTTPYGYGGPFAWNASETAAERFWAAFDDWAATARVVSSFARLSLFPGQRIPFRGDVEVNAPNVVRGLNLSEQEIWRDYAHKVRKNVTRARRSALRVSQDESGEFLDDFMAIYHATMDRRQAAKRYYFPRAFFEALIRDLRGQFRFFHVWKDERLISTELVLVSTDYIYSFLGGTEAGAFALRPNDLLKHEIILWGVKTGKKAFVLGGGYGGEDGIFRYKKAFAPQGVVPFEVGKRIHDAGAYEGLIERRRRWERKQGRAWTPRPGFFPAYRA